MPWAESKNSRQAQSIDGRRPFYRYWRSREEFEKDRASDREPRAVEWSLIDRWLAHPVLTDAYTQLINNKMDIFRMTSATRRLFSSALPIDDSTTCRHVLRISESLGHRYPYKLAWFNSWTLWPIPIVGLLNGGQHGLTKSLTSFVHAGRTNVLIVPLPYTTPTIDTEILLKSICRNDVLKKVGIHHARFVRPPGDDSAFIHGLAEIMKNHYLNDSRTSSQFSLRCRKCVWPSCDGSRRIFPVQ